MSGYCSSEPFSFRIRLGKTSVGLLYGILE